jgi:hypothetical protein
MVIEQAKRTTDQITGIPNVTYDLISVMHNKLQAIASIEGYKHDAQSDREVLGLLERIQGRETEDLGELKKVLGNRLR